MLQRLTPLQLRAVFDVFDSDADGTCTREEIAAGLKLMGVDVRRAPLLPCTPASLYSLSAWRRQLGWCARLLSLCRGAVCDLTRAAVKTGQQRDAAALEKTMTSILSSFDRSFDDDSDGPADAVDFQVSFLGDAESSLGDGKSSLGDAKSLPGCRGFPELRGLVADASEAGAGD
jgi:hypothetical protein